MRRVIISLLIILFPLIILAQSGSTFVFTLQSKSTGLRQPGKNVDLYQNGVKKYNLTEVAPGIYKGTNIQTGIYDIRVNGSQLSEYSGIFIGGQKLVTIDGQFTDDGKLKVSTAINNGAITYDKLSETVKAQLGGNHISRDAPDDSTIGIKVNGSDTLIAIKPSYEHSLKQIPTVNSISELTQDSLSYHNVVFLKGLNSGSNIGAGYLVKVDSTYPEYADEGVAFNAPETGKQWMRVDFLRTGVAYPEYWGLQGNFTISDTATWEDDAVTINKMLDVANTIVLSGSYYCKTPIDLDNKTIISYNAKIYTKYDGKLLRVGYFNTMSDTVTLVGSGGVNPSNISNGYEFIANRIVVSDGSKFTKDDLILIVDQDSLRATTKIGELGLIRYVTADTIYLNNSLYAYYPSSHNVYIVKIEASEFTQIGNLSLYYIGNSASGDYEFQSGETSSIAFYAKFSKNISVQKISAFNFPYASFMLQSCYAPNMNIFARNSRQSETGYGLAINNATTNGIFNVNIVGARHCVTSGSSSGGEGISWNNKLSGTLIGSYLKNFTAPTLFTHRETGSIILENIKFRNYGNGDNTGTPNGSYAFHLSAYENYVNNCILDGYQSIGYIRSYGEPIKRVEINNIQIKNTQYGISIYDSMDHFNLSNINFETPDNLQCYLLYEGANALNIDDLNIQNIINCGGLINFTSVGNNINKITINNVKSKSSIARFIYLYKQNINELNIGNIDRVGDKSNNTYTFYFNIDTINNINVSNLKVLNDYSVFRFSGDFDIDKIRINGLIADSLNYTSNYTSSVLYFTDGTIANPIDNIFMNGITTSNVYNLIGAPATAQCATSVKFGIINHDSKLANYVFNSTNVTNVSYTLDRYINSIEFTDSGDSLRFILTNPVKATADTTEKVGLH